MKYFKYFLWWPGYLLLTIGYFFPNEWGYKRSVAKSSRRWKYNDQIAPIISLMFYIPFWLAFINGVVNPT